jgi:hypothetical protein
MTNTRCTDTILLRIVIYNHMDHNGHNYGSQLLIETKSQNMYLLIKFRKPYHTICISTPSLKLELANYRSMLGSCASKIRSVPPIRSFLINK